MSAKAPPKKKDGSSDGAYELEQQFILRLPENVAGELRKDLNSTSGGSLNDNLGLSIEMDPDNMRHGHVRYKNHIFNSKLVDLPCIVESYKTVDKKTFYKTADICQMLVCTTEDDVNVEETESPKKKDKEKRYLWNHGLTPPLKNVRKRRFRKTMKKKYMDQPEVEKELRRLFRCDAEAIEVKWEILTEDEKPVSSEAGETSGHIQSSGAMSTSGGLQRVKDQSGTMDVASFFGEVSSSEDEDEDKEEEKDDDKDVNIMDSGAEDDTSRLEESSMQAAESQDPMGADGAEETDLYEKLEELVQQLEEIREKRLELESQMAEEDNDMMRDRIREDLERFLQEESEKEKEYEILSAMLNQL